ncbi:hypothetical protein M569_05777 [Genlisea aurea]|uniref:Ataxin-2 C-terminal domain-containing protein n=1 Tax=Genlisea aurea TaxID=192259 RepID=S8E949_9LAMI|nr:hypothetical protein M569_05777 [Genlisea aurea]
MALVSGVRSTLNPNAPLFIPATVRQVEDFSPEWWHLVTTSTWFREYWISQQKEEDIYAGNDPENYLPSLPDMIDLGVDDDILNMEIQFEEFLQSSEMIEQQHDYEIKGSFDGITENGHEKALVKNLNMPKERGPLVPHKNWEKPAKIVSPRCSPRIIHQPR